MNKEKFNKIYKKAIKIGMIILSLLRLILIFIFNLVLVLTKKIFFFSKELIVKFLNSKSYKRNKKTFLLFIKRKRKMLFALFKKKKKIFLKFYKKENKKISRYYFKFVNRSEALKKINGFLTIVFGFLLSLLIVFRKKIVLFAQILWRNFSNLFAQKLWFRVSTFSVLGMIFVFIIFSNKNISAATYTFIQNNWSGGTSPDIAIHPDGQSMWNKFFSKGDGLEISEDGGSLSLDLDNDSFVQNDFVSESIDNLEINEAGDVSFLTLGKSNFTTPKVLSGYSLENALVLKSDGTVWSWGNWSAYVLGHSHPPGNYPDYVRDVVNGSQFVDVFDLYLGSSMVMAIKNNNVWSWGGASSRAYPAQVMDGSAPLSNVVKTAANTSCGYALKSDGTVWSWNCSSNSNGEMGDGTFVHKSGVFQVVGPNNEGYLTDIIDISATIYSAYAVRSDGTVWSWGSNYSGLLGNDSADNSSYPVRVGQDEQNYLTGVISVIGGDYSAYALKSDGTVWSWGSNGWGQLGDNTGNNRSYPVQVKGAEGFGFLDDVSALSASHYSAYALKSDGTVLSWGKNSSGQLGIGTVSDGYNFPKVVLDPSGQGSLEGIANISSGYYSAYAINSAGDLFSWGENDRGQLGDSTNIDKYLPVLINNFNVGYNSYHSSGTYTSTVIDLELIPANLSTLELDQDLPSGTAITIDIRAGNDSDTSDSSWTDWTSGLLDDSDISFLGSKRYVQYRANLSTSDDSVSPTLNAVNFNYSYYPTNQTLISSKYDTLDSANVIGLLGMDEGGDSPEGTEAILSIRTASTTEGLDSALWYDFTNSSSGCSKENGKFICSASAIPVSLKDGENDRFWQYKVTLNSEGFNAPVISEVEVRYVVNAPPEVQNVTAEQKSDGQVEISYEVRDVDSLAGSNTPGEILPSFEYYYNSSWVSCTTLSSGALDLKDVDTEEFTPYTLTWDAKTDLNGQYLENIKIRVSIDDGEAANNVDRAESAVFTLDTKDPVVSIFSVDGRSDITNNVHISAIDDNMSGLKIKLSNNSNLSSDSINSDSGQWIDYVSYKSWILDSSGTPTVYYQIKDNYNNISNAGTISTVSISSRPANIIFQDVSNVSTSEWREFIAWGQSSISPLIFKQYNIYRSTDGENFSLAETQDDRLSNFILESDLNTSNIYYYKVAIEDKSGNISRYSDVIYDRPDGQGGTDLTPPVITLVSISEKTAQSALITWETDEPSDSFVAHITDDSGDFDDALGVGISAMADNDSGLGKHSIFLNHLDPGTTYYLRVSSADPSRNVSYYEEELSFETLDGPVISDVFVENVSNSGATITWDSSDYADSRVFYSTSTSMVSPSEVAISESAMSHSVNLTGLNNGLRYYFYVQSGVAEDRNIIDGELIYYNFLTTADIIAPQIEFDPDTDITDETESSVRISWLTDELAISRVEYSIDDSYEYYVANSNFNTDHSFDLSGLEKGATYNLRLRSADSNNNPRVLSDLTFTVPDYSDVIEPTISEVVAKQVADVSALITWRTDEATDSTVEYGTTSGDYDNIATSSALNYSHSVLLEDLSIKTTYYFKVSSSDANDNSTSSEEYSFITQDALVAGATSTTIIVKEGGGVLVIDKSDKTSPKISGLQVKNIGLDQATISWATDEPANSVVKFGLDKKYEQASVGLEVKTAHSQILSNLSPDTIYYYQVSSSDSSGNISDFEIGTFTTLSLENIEDLDELLDFDDLDPGVEEGEDGFDDIISPEEQAKNDDNFMEILRRTFSFIRQAAKSVSSSILESSLIEQQEAIMELANMTEPPKIVSGPIVNVWEDMAILTWETDKKTGSLVSLAEDEASLSNYNLMQSFGNSEIYTTEHQVIIPGLKSATTYSYQLKGDTQIGSRVYSTPDNFTTLSKSAKIENYVIDRLGDESASFKWTSSSPTNSLVRAIPYRNGSLSMDEAIAVSSDKMTTIHEITIDDLESGTLYRIDLSGRDSGGQVLSQTIESFSTSNEAMTFVIEQVKTSSALAGAEGLRVQSIISWNTSKLSTSKVYYRQGIGQDDGNWPLETVLDPAYTRRHLVVVTDFSPGEVYQFQVESEDSNGNKIRSNTYTILTPRQRESVFQVILKNIEQTFGWMGAFNK